MFEKVCEVLSEFTDIEVSNMRLDTDLLNDLEINSLEIMEAVIRFEEEFKIEIPDRKISSFHTIGDIVNYINDF